MQNSTSAPAEKDLSNIITIDEGQIHQHLGEMVRSTVEETLNDMLDAEADRLCNAKRYERSEGRTDGRAGHYKRKLHTKAARRTGRRIVLVMDQGSPHHAEALARYLDHVKEHLEVFWLPHYSPELNLIERLWKHLKASRMANVLPPSFEAFTRHLHDALTQFALHPDFALSVPAPTSQRTRQKNILVAT